MMAKKKKKRKSKVKKAWFLLLNIAVFLLVIYYGIPLSMYAGRFYGELFKAAPQKTKTLTKKVRTYHASYRGGKYHY